MGAGGVAGMGALIDSGRAWTFRTRGSMLVDFGRAGVMDLGGGMTVRPFATVAGRSSAQAPTPRASAVFRDRNAIAALALDPLLIRALGVIPSVLNLIVMIHPLATTAAILSQGLILTIVRHGSSSGFALILHPLREKPAFSPDTTLLDPP